MAVRNPVNGRNPLRGRNPLPGRNPVRGRNPVSARELDAAGIHGAALRAGYLRCRALNARHGRTFYLATLLLPPDRRPFVHALYGLARHVDDLVDQTPELTDGARERLLDDWTGEFLTDLEWGGAADPVARAAIDTITRWSIPSDYLRDFVAAMRMDLTVTSYATWEDLRGYMWGSAAVIGLQLLPVLGRRDDAVRWDVLEPYAIDLGYAFQLTNFIRDVGEDLRRGRLYLPQEDLDRFGVDEVRLRRGIVDESLRGLLAWQIERARGLYRSAEPGIALVAPEAQDCLRTAATLYAEILDAVEAADYDVFTHRASVGIGRRAAVGAGGWRRAVTARRGVSRAGVPSTPTVRA